ncbi:MAG: zf-HC2 domain-containing protein [Candidatus Eremiobacteraeota bacterium]|nr:zf-HC2 domain-containing protein [Candidatus Eremiobacteraeota bacterium]
MNNHLSTDLLIDFLHGELSPAEDALAHTHMATCAACRAEYDLEASLTGALRASALAEEREMPSLVNAAVWQLIREARPGPFTRVAAWLRPAVAVPIAALLIVGGWFALPHPATAPTIDASYYFQTHAAQSSQTSLSERTSGAQAFETSSTRDSGGDAPPLVERTAIGFAAAGTFDAVQ